MIREQSPRRPQNRREDDEACSAQTCGGGAQGKVIAEERRKINGERNEAAEGEEVKREGSDEAATSVPEASDMP
jgi:hypothetical protein